MIRASIVGAQAFPGKAMPSPKAAITREINFATRLHHHLASMFIPHRPTFHGYRLAVMKTAAMKH